MQAMKMKLILAALLAMFLGEAQAQVMQTGGGVTPQHLAMWAANNVIQDAAGAARTAQGLQPLELGLLAPPNTSGNPFPATASGTGPNGEIACLYDSPLGQAGHYMCFTPNIGGGVASIDIGPTGGGTNGSLQFLINGTKIAFPGPGNGTVVGPGTTTAGNVACWNNTLGTILADCGPGGTLAPLVPTQSLADNSTQSVNSAWVKGQGYLTTAAASVAPQGRLSLQSNNATPGNLGSGLTTIYYVGYVGNLVPVWNGSTNVLLTIGGGGNISDVVPATGAGIILPNNVVDVFAVNVSGTLTLCHATNGAGGGWASDSGGTNISRGSGYSAISRTPSGFYTNVNSLSNCFNGATNLGSIAANQATYLGTAYTTGSNTFTWNISTAASGGCLGTSAVTLGIWNYYNRLSYNLQCFDSGISYTYVSSVIRQARASSGNQIIYVKGVAEEQESVYLNGRVFVTGTSANTGMGLGVTATAFGTLSPTCVVPGGLVGGTNFCSGTVVNQLYSATGLTTIYRLEQGDGINPNTFDQNTNDSLGVIVKG